jgi:nucleotide-binding universal stress UspA family protein
MFRTILVHLTGTECDGAALTTALQIATPFSAHLTCLRVTPDPAALIAQATTIDMGTAMVLADTLGAIEQQASEHTNKARAIFDQFCGRHDIVRSDSPAQTANVAASWREGAASDEFDCLVAEARFHDAVVLAGGPERSGRLPDAVLGSVAIGGGRPVILAPEHPSLKPIKTIAVAWKNSPESARAITAAMPLLAKADRVDVFTANEDDAEAKYCVDCGERVVQQLRWHGLNAHAHFVIPAGRTAPDAVLETAHSFAADLLVMGAYGHSRLREFIFGGFTQRILRGAAIPVFLFH